jgi:hypothetical protein
MDQKRRVYKPILFPVAGVRIENCQPLRRIGSPSLVQRHHISLKHPLCWPAFQHVAYRVYDPARMEVHHCVVGIHRAGHAIYGALEPLVGANRDGSRGHRVGGRVDD